MVPAPLRSTAAAAGESCGRAVGDRTTARLFYALWPDEATRRALTAQQAQWQWTPASRPTRGERLHATLLFLGAGIARERVPQLIAQCPRLDRPVALVLDVPQLWPRGTAVLAASELPEPLAALHDDLRQRCAMPPRAWRPHVTLARRAEGAVPPANAEPIVWQVERGVLVESDLRPPARYRVLG